MGAREFEGKKDLEGMQGDDSDFKAKQCYIHILIVLKQEGQS